MMTLRLLFFTLIAITSITNLNSKSLNPGQKNGHEDDIYLALPFERCDSISLLIKVIHDNIDHPIGYFKGLRDAPHQNFTWRKYGHLVFFHWGFNSNPRNCKILQSLIDECNWTKQHEESFWIKIINEQARRNKESMMIVSNILNFQLSGTQRNYANAFASIITDIHILGDYSTTNISTLQNIDNVIADIKKALFESLKGEDAAKRINKLLDDTKQIDDVKERANKTLLILQQELPSFFLQIQDGFFAKHFTKLGLPLKQL